MVGIEPFDLGRDRRKLDDPEEMLPPAGGAMPVLTAARSAVPDIAAGDRSVIHSIRDTELRLERTILCGLSPSSSTTALPSSSTTVTTRRTFSLSGMKVP
jgi:hypothetical protein